MNKPVLSLDVSKNSSFAATFLSPNNPLDKPFSVKHTPGGIITLLDRLAALENATGFKPDVILEATGNYSKPIAHNLQEAGYAVIILNPIQTHMYKRSSIRKVKTDSVDAVRIANIYYQQKLTPQAQINPIIADLRTLCRHYDGVNGLFISTQLKFQQILDLIFPYYKSVFSEYCCNSSLKLIESFPTPEEVLAAPENSILNILQSANQSQCWMEKTYGKLMAAAKICLPYKLAQQSNIRALREYVNILLTHKKTLTELRAQLIATAKLLPTFDLLKSIPGIGDITAAAIISEIQDIHRFPSHKQLTAFAGLDASVFQSGKFKATNNKISKRGSTYLRKALYQAATAGVRKNKTGPVNPLLYEYYQQKVTEGKPKRVALIATCNKLLRIIYGMWSKNQPFRA